MCSVKSWLVETHLNGMLWDDGNSLRWQFERTSLSSVNILSSPCLQGSGLDSSELWHLLTSSGLQRLCQSPLVSRRSCLILFEVSEWGKYELPATRLDPATFRVPRAGFWSSLKRREMLRWAPDGSCLSTPKHSPNPRKGTESDVLQWLDSSHSCPPTFSLTSAHLPPSVTPWRDVGGD